MTPGTSAGEFTWAVGIEDTFVPQVRAGHRRLDEYELMDHYRRWRDDLDRAADLGISAIRYGIPWYRVNPSPGVFDWSWVDSVLEYLVEVKRIAPIVDLVHYGTPLWLEGEFAAASYPERVAEYAAAFAGRYGRMVRHYTPLNEPGVTAAYCGRNGRWPPYLRGDRGYARVLLALARGIVRTAEALRSIQPDAILVHVEDVGLERAARPDLAELADRAQERRLLPLDLACGRVVQGHPGYPWLVEQGATGAELDDLAARAPRWDILGVNYYPWSNRVIYRRTNGRVVAAVDRRPGAAGLGPLLRSIHERYRLPLMVTETSSDGSHAVRARWMGDTLAAVRRARDGGVPVVGYTWFPMFTMVDWRYRWSRRGRGRHLLHLGLWDVHPRGRQLEREPTPLVDAYRRFAAAPADSIGEGPATVRPPGVAIGRVGGVGSRISATERPSAP